MWCYLAKTVFSRVNRDFGGFFLEEILCKIRQNLFKFYQKNLDQKYSMKYEIKKFYFLKFSLKNLIFHKFITPAQNPVTLLTILLLSVVITLGHRYSLEISGFLFFRWHFSFFFLFWRFSGDTFTHSHFFCGFSVFRLLIFRSAHPIYKHSSPTQLSTTLNHKCRG